MENKMHTKYNHFSDSELVGIIDSSMWTTGLMDLIPLLQEASSRIAKAGSCELDNTPQLNLFK
jgi:hypothetical protein